MSVSAAVWPAQPALKRVRLELARSPEFPDGSARHGYEFVVPLDSKGHIDAEQWRLHRNQCVVRRFWGDARPTVGRVVHKPGGPDHARWIFDYVAATDDDDEPGFRFGAHSFRIGDYVSISGRAGKSHTFKVASVEPFHPA